MIRRDQIFIVECPFNESASKRNPRLKQVQIHSPPQLVFFLSHHYFCLIILFVSSFFLSHHSFWLIILFVSSFFLSHHSFLAHHSFWLIILFCLIIRFVSSFFLSHHSFCLIMLTDLFSSENCRFLHWRVWNWTIQDSSCAHHLLNRRLPQIRSYQVRH